MSCETKDLREAAAKISDILRPFENEGRITIKCEFSEDYMPGSETMHASLKTILKIEKVVIG